MERIQKNMRDELHIARLLRQEEESPWRIVVRWAIGILFFGTVIAIVLDFGEMRHFLDVLIGIKARWIALAILAQGCTYICAAAVWHEVMKHSGHPLSLKSLFPLTIAQLFARQTVPTGGISGALMVVKGFLNRDISEPVGMGCMMVGMVSYYVAYLMAVVISLAVLGIHHDISAVLFVAGAIFSLVAVGIPAGVFWLYYIGINNHVPDVVLRLPLAYQILKVLPEIPVNLLKNPVLLFKATVLQFGVFLIDSATLFIMLKAIGFPLPFGMAFASHVMASVAATIGPVPLGLGAYEGTGVALLHVSGLPVEAALVAVLLLRGFTFWLPMIPGFWLARWELRNHHHGVR